MIPVIAFLPGDGIGPEIVAQARKVLDALAPFGFQYEALVGEVGAAALDRHGHPLPEQTLAMVDRADAVLFGAVGDPRYDHLAAALRPEKALVGLRNHLELFANLKQVAVPADLASLSPLKDDRVAGMDLLVVRELTGDVYTGVPRGQRTAPDGPCRGEPEGFDTMRYAESEVRRVARIAFEAARGRSGRLASLDKSNVLETSRLWRRVVEETGREFPDVVLSHLYADNALMQLLARPIDFDVVVTGNLFGDLVSDAASVLTGSVAMCGSAMLGESRKGMYEAGNGTALDIAGQDRANPIACIRAVALMLRHSFGREDLARNIEAAVLGALRSGLWTHDLTAPQGSRVVGCDGMGDAIAVRIEAPSTTKTRDTLRNAL